MLLVLRSLSSLCCSYIMQVKCGIDLVIEVDMKDFLLVFSPL